MTRKASISHEDAIIEELRKDPDYAAEYLRAALEESDEPKVLLVAAHREGADNAGGGEVSTERKNISTAC